MDLSLHSQHAVAFCLWPLLVPLDSLTINVALAALTSGTPDVCLLS